jgi:two-component system CheB/CheR fusion protein
VNEELHTVNQERRVKIEELAQVNADLRNLINSTGVATIFLDRDLRIRRFTPTVAGLFNFLDSDEGRPVGDVTHRLDYPELVDDARQVLHSLERSEREVPANDGRWFAARIVPYRSLDDHVDGVVLTFMDTTARKQAETDRQWLLEEARAASEAKSRLIGVLSHDFRTPLGAVKGYAELLADGTSGPVNEKQKEQLQRVVAAARQLDGMADDLLSHTRAETRTATVNLEDVDACAVARELARMVELQAGVKGLEMRVELDERPLHLRSDPEMLRHILTNLLNNAIKFTAEGYVALTVHGGSGEVTFDVEDTGAGIEPEDLPRIFERFWQGRPGGTGLGLSIVKEYIELLGGQVEVDSEPGRGSRFRVRLPIDPPASTSARMRRAVESEAGRGTPA